MLLGKRPRPPVMRRTTSMSGGMAVDVLEAEEEVMCEDGIKDPPHAVAMGRHHDGSLVFDQTKNVFGAKGYEYEPKTTTTTTTNHRQNQTSNLTHVIHTANFLRTCGLCKCRLTPSRDIYMYRGDTAFCSSECREKQMKQDQRKEKGRVSSNKKDHRASPSTAATATAKASTISETTACT